MQNIKLFKRFWNHAGLSQFARLYCLKRTSVCLISELNCIITLKTQFRRIMMKQILDVTQDSTTATIQLSSFNICVDFQLIWTCDIKNGRFWKIYVKKKENVLSDVCVPRRITIISRIFMHVIVFHQVFVRKMWRVWVDIKYQPILDSFPGLKVHFRTLCRIKDVTRKILAKNSYTKFQEIVDEFTNFAKASILYQKFPPVIPLRTPKVIYVAYLLILDICIFGNF